MTTHTFECRNRISIKALLAGTTIIAFWIAVTPSNAQNDMCPILNTTITDPLAHYGLTMPPFVNVNVDLDDPTVDPNAPSVNLPSSAGGDPNLWLLQYHGLSGEGHANGGVWADLNNDGYPELYLIRGNDELLDNFNTENKLYLNKPKPGAADPAHERIYELHTINGAPVANHDGDATGAIAGDSIAGIQS